MAKPAEENTAAKWITFEDELAGHQLAAFRCWGKVSEVVGRPIYQLYVRRPDGRHWWVFGENDAPQMVDGTLPKMARKTAGGPIVEGALSVLAPHDGDLEYPDVGRALRLIRAKLAASGSHAR